MASMKKLLLSLSLALSLLIPSEAAPRKSQTPSLSQQFPVRNAPRRSKSRRTRRTYTRNVPQTRILPSQSRAATQTQSITVWANHRSYIYHYPGTRWYGVSRNSGYMKESDAIRAGYRAARNGQ